jgi:hypothetical protein
MCRKKGRGNAAVQGSIGVFLEGRRGREELRLWLRISACDCLC